MDANEMTRTEMRQAAEARKEELRAAARAFIAAKAPADKVEEYTADLVEAMDQITATTPWTDLMRADENAMIQSAGLRATNNRRARQ